MIRQSMLTLVVIAMISGALYAQRPATRGEETETKIYDVKWRDVKQIASLVNSFIDSGRVTHNAEFRTITVITRPDLQPMVAELLRKYDQPAREMEFQFYLLRGVRQGTGIKDGVPEKVQAILADVGSLTEFKAFELVDSPVVRAMEGADVRVDSLSGVMGSIGMEGPALVTREDGRLEIRIDRFSLNLRFPIKTTATDKEKSDQQAFRSAGVTTAFRIVDGETIVIGSSGVPESAPTGGRPPEAGKTSGDAIIAVVSARVL